MGFSGGETQVFLLMEGLRERGHGVHLVCQPNSQAEAAARERGFPVQTVPMKSHVDLTTVHRLRKAYAQVGADLVHTNTGRDAWLGGWAAHRAGLASVTTRRMDRRVKRGFRTRLTYTSFVQKTVAISPGVRACLEAGGVPTERIVLIPEAADPARVSAERSAPAVRKDLGVAEHEVLLLGMGALLPRKGFDVMLESVGRLPAHLRERVQVRIGGEGESREAWAALARARGIQDRVRFLGQRTDIGDLLQAADVFVMPSRREGLGVAALEAMAAGLPVIASRVGGLAFSVVDGETGFHAEPEDIDGFATAIARLVEDEALRGRLGEAAGERARSRFSKEVMVDAYEALYAAVLASRPPTREASQ